MRICRSLEAPRDFVEGFVGCWLAGRGLGMATFVLRGSRLFVWCSHAELSLLFEARYVSPYCSNHMCLMQRFVKELWTRVLGTGFLRLLTHMVLSVCILRGLVLWPVLHGHGYWDSLTVFASRMPWTFVCSGLIQG